MAVIALGFLGSAIGAGVGGAVLGVSAATIGGAVGTLVGGALSGGGGSGGGGFEPQTTHQRVEGARLDALRISTATEGAVIPQVFGRMRLGGTIIWTTDLREVQSERVTDLGDGAGSTLTEVDYAYFLSFALAICAGPVRGIGRIWADGEELSPDRVTIRVYTGTQDQEADPAIVAAEGVERAPAYRGTAYVVFEEFPLSDFENRIPQLSFEVLRPLAEQDTAEGLVRAVTIIPASGEFAYGTGRVSKGGAVPFGFGGAATLSYQPSRPINFHANPDRANIEMALDQLEAAAPNIESVSLVVAWFGSDLRAGDCRIEPRQEAGDAWTSRPWRVGGLDRFTAPLVSRKNGVVSYGGAIDDAAVIEAIAACKARGLRVTFYPFILMDIPEGNDLPDPYSDDAVALGQPVFPWRGRITCSPAPGVAGSVDTTPEAGAQVAAFFGAAQPGHFTVATNVAWPAPWGAGMFAGTFRPAWRGIGGADPIRIAYTGSASDFGLRRMILHYATLCDAAGGVDAFLIGSELRGLTTIRDGAASYPAVQAFRDLAADVRSIVGAGTKISYAADWSEYFGHHPADGSGDVFFHLDPLWSDPEIDFVGIDNYMPLSDWRDGFEHADAQEAPSIYDRAYLQANIEGGEGFDWFYASDADRAAQVRTPITDGAYGKPWVFRYKDLRSWWSQPHYDRPGGVESATPTPWVPQSKPIWFTEYGCPAVDRGTNQPNVFFDLKSSESFVPYFSRGWRDDTIQRAYLEAVLSWWGTPANNPVSAVYGGRMVHLPEAAAWTWDARPYPFFPELTDVWTDGANWRLGHWLTGRLGSVQLGALVRLLCLRAGLPAERIDVSGLWGAVEGYLITALESPRVSISALARHFGFDAVESGGKVVFRMRGRGPVGSVSVDDLVAARNANGEALELVRGQETELPQALQWQLARADEDYDAAMVEARRITVQASRIASEAFAMAVPTEEAERRVRRALMEAWRGRESASFRVPPSRLAWEPGDVVGLEHDGRTLEVRLASTADGEDRALEGVLDDRGIYDLPPGEPRSAALSRPVLFGAPAAAFLNLPQLREGDPEWQPYFGAFARPWPGSVSVWRSATLDDFAEVTAVTLRARFGVLVEALGAGPVSRFDLANALVVDVTSGTLAGVSDLALFNGANALAVESAPGVWEVLQFGAAELQAPGRYRLTRLLRGQRGTEQAIAASVAPGARVVVLDGAVAPLPLPETDIGQPWNWRVGPSSRPVGDDSFVGVAFTPAGLGLRPFSVAHVEQPFRQGRVPGDLTIRWKRRSRALVADSWEALEVPLAEEAEAYEVDILDGATVLRTLASAGPSVVYTNAQQIADFGAALGPGDTLDVRIAQMSGLVGRGAQRTVTLEF